MVMSCLMPPGPVDFKSMADLTQILSAIEQGDPHAAEQRLPLVYDEPHQTGVAALGRREAGTNAPADRAGA